MIHDSRALQPLAVPKCMSCERRFWYPRSVCGRCDEETVLESALFDGVVYSTTTVRRSKPEWRDSLPFHVALIVCDAGFRILTQFDELEIGDPVVVGQRDLHDFGLIPFSEKRAS